MTTITDLLADEVRARANASMAIAPILRQLGDTIAAQLIAECLVDRQAAHNAGAGLLHTAERLQVLLDEAHATGKTVQAQLIVNVVSAAGERLWHGAEPTEALR